MLFAHRQTKRATQRLREVLAPIQYIYIYIYMLNWSIETLGREI